MLICDILFPFILYDTGAIFSNNLLPDILSRKSPIFSLSKTTLPSCGKNLTTASVVNIRFNSFAVFSLYDKLLCLSIIQSK